MFEVTLWGRRQGVDETLGSYKLWLKPDNFEESKSLHQAWVPLSGTKFNIPHPDDVAAQKAYEAAGSVGAPPKVIKELPHVQIDLFCRQVPIAGQCDSCRAVMRDPLADDVHRDIDLHTLSLRAPFTLPCSHTVCGEHLVGTGVCPCCDTKVHDLDVFHNYLTDKYLELRMSEFSKTCANCDGPRARIFCPQCRYFFCSKCDTTIHDRNPFFRAHARKDARKPFKIQRAHVHLCADHEAPLIFYDSRRPVGTQGMCQQCVDISPNKEEYSNKGVAIGHDGAIKDYESYRRYLTDDIVRRVEALSRITSRDLQLYQADVLHAQETCATKESQLLSRLSEERKALPSVLDQQGKDLQTTMAGVLKQQEAVLEKQSALWANCAVSLLKQNNMVEYVVGPVLEDETNVKIPERAAKLDLTQLYQIRVALLAQFHQKFSHAPYAQARVKLSVDNDAHTLFYHFGSVNDHDEDDRLNNGSFVIKLNTQAEKFLQLKRSIKAGDLPYFFAIRTTAKPGGRCPQIAYLGATRYGVVSERPLGEASQLRHSWLFNARSDVQSRVVWRYYHDATYVDVGFKDVELSARFLGESDGDAKADSDPRQPRTDSDIVGCLVDRAHGMIEFFCYTPHSDPQSAAGSLYFSQTPCVMECADVIYPTLALAEDSDEGVVEIAASRFVLNRSEAINVFRECFVAKQ
jgi:hypothetical protein